MAPSDLLMSSNEMVQGHSLLWHCALDHMKSMSLKCAIELGIPDAIHKHGQPIPCSKLVTLLSIHPSKANFLYRLMRILVHCGLFKSEKVIVNDQTQEEEEAYSLTNASQLLLTDESAFTNLQPFTLFFLLPKILSSWHSWSSWFRSKDDKTVFEIAEGMTVWEYTSLEPNLSRIFNDMGKNDSLLVSKITLEECKEVFDGLTSLVDIGGGTGTMAQAIANAFPNINCTVFDLPHVVANLHAETTHDNLNFIGGNVFSDPIPPTDAILLKNVLHGWNDEVCVIILKRCREAVLRNGKEGKIILIEMIVGNQSTDKKPTELELLNDVYFMGINAKERTLMEWEKLFSATGLNHYKIVHTFGVRSVIEVYP